MSASSPRAHGFSVERTAFAGCYAITLRHAGDERGSFTKLFARQDFVAAGLACDWQEYFSTWSERGVLRGFHFQAPPADYAKLVSCLHGRVLDVALDLRRSSPTYGRHLKLELSAERANAVYLAPGLAHAFYVLDGPALVQYTVTTGHAPQLDSGVRWDSCGVDWPLAGSAPLLSPRDHALPAWSVFQSPFP